MGFWQTVWSNVLGGIGAGLFFVFMYLFVQWFLQATDLLVSYNWSYKTVGGVFSAWPNFDIKNRSRTRAYRIANIAYTHKGEVRWFDNDSLWGFVLEPGTINNKIAGASVKNVGSLQDALGLEVTVRLQTGRAFWLRGEGPGQMGRGRIQKALFALRAKMESMMVAME
jgi:hypothetical protein